MERTWLEHVRGFFKVYEGEERKVLAFALLGAVLQCGVAIGGSAGDALFLNRVGAAHLPLVYLLFPIAAALYIASHTLLIARLGIDRVLDLTLIGLALVIVLLSVMLNLPALGAGRWAGGMYYAVKICTMLAYVALYTLYWNVADSYFTILDAKRVFAYLSAGCALGAAVGGAVVDVVSASITVEQMFLLWSALALLSLPIAARIRGSCEKLEADHGSEAQRSIRAEVQSLAGTYRRSPFALCVTAALFLSLAVCLLCEYQYYGVLAEGRSEAELASLLGRLNCGVSIFNLVINLFIFNRLVEWVGVRNLALVQPIAFIGVFSFLVVEHSELAAVFGFFAYHGLFIAIDGNNFNLLLHALPDRERKQLRTFIEGACEPLAHACVGGGLVLAAAALSPAQISIAGLVLAVLSFFLALMLRSGYVAAMLANMRSRWLDFSLLNCPVSAHAKLQGLKSRDMLPLLSLAPQCSPAERRLLEHHLCLLGSRAVPGTVHALEDERLPIRCRALAARVLARVSFPQLESMANRLVDRTLRLSYGTFLWERELEAAELPDYLRAFAVRMAADRRTALIEFMLEVLTLSGRLANFEPLAASLRSSDEKARGTAIETIEQACSRDLRRLLRPLLDEREGDKRLAFARELHDRHVVSMQSGIEQQIESGDMLESAAALEILEALDSERARSIAERFVEQERGGLRRDIACAVLARAQGGQATTIIERAARLLSHPFTASLRASTLVAFAGALQVTNGMEGTRNATRLLEISDRGVSILGERESRHHCAQDTRSIYFNLERLLAGAETDPVLGIGLYRILGSSVNAHEARA